MHTAKLYFLFWVAGSGSTSLLWTCIIPKYMNTRVHLVQVVVFRERFCELVLKCYLRHAPDVCYFICMHYNT